MIGKCAPMPSASILRLKSSHTSIPGTNCTRWELQSQRLAGKLLVFYNELEIISTSNFKIIIIIFLKSLTPRLAMFFWVVFFCFFGFCLYSFLKTYYESSFQSIISYFLRKIKILMM